MPRITNSFRATAVQNAIERPFFLKVPNSNAEIRVEKEEIDTFMERETERDGERRPTKRMYICVGVGLRLELVEGFSACKHIKAAVTSFLVRQYLTLFIYCYVAQHVLEKSKSSISAAWCICARSIPASFTHTVWHFISCNISRPSSTNTALVSSIRHRLQRSATIPALPCRYPPNFCIASRSYIEWTYCIKSSRSRASCMISSKVPRDDDDSHAVLSKEGKVALKQRYTLRAAKYGGERIKVGPAVNSKAG